MSLRFKMLGAFIGIVSLTLVIGLLVWDIPAPSNEIKKILTHDQLMRHQIAP